MAELPRVVHSIWIGSSPLPQFAKRCLGSWSRLGWQVKLLGNEEVVKLPVFGAIARDLIENPGKHPRGPLLMSEMIRTEIVFRFGGFWIDTDVELLRPFGPFIGPVLGNKPEGQYGEAQPISFLFGFPAGHEYLKRMIEVQRERLPTLLTSKYNAGISVEAWRIVQGEFFLPYSFRGQVVRSKFIGKRSVLTDEDGVFALHLVKSGWGRK